MTRWKRWLRWSILLCGVWAFLVGVGLAFGIAPASFVAIERSLGSLGARAVVALVGMAAVGYALLMAGIVRTREGWLASLPEPERIPDRPQPGAMIDDRLSDDPIEGDDRLREQLVVLATETLADIEELSHDAAAERISAGDWPDDPVAAAVLTSESVALPPAELLREWLSPEPRSVRRFRRTLDAIEAETQQDGESS